MEPAAGTLHAGCPRQVRGTSVQQQHRSGYRLGLEGQPTSARYAAGLPIASSWQRTPEKRSKGSGEDQPDPTEARAAKSPAPAGETNSAAWYTKKEDTRIVPRA